MRENVGMNQTDNEVLALKMKTGDLTGVQMTGHCIDRIYKNGELVEEIEGHNLVVNSFLNLVMCLLKHQNGYSGIQYWAVGSGSSSWDSNNNGPSLNDARLTNEIGRVPISASDISFLNSNNVKVSSPTNIIQIERVFGEEDCNGTWREFAIFGGNATQDSNSGIMINKRHHPIISKTNEMTIQRVMRFTLSLV